MPVCKVMIVTEPASQSCGWNQVKKLCKGTLAKGQARVGAQTSRRLMSVAVEYVSRAVGYIL